MNPFDETLGHPVPPIQDQATNSYGSDRGLSPDRSGDELPQIPGFTLRHELGSGGMGVVYLARDLSLQRDVAIKLLQAAISSTSQAARRFVDEAHITSQLQHPGVPAVYQMGTLEGDRPYLALKLIKGLTLEEMLEGGKKVDLLAVFESICQTVGYAHAHNVVHRDLKPRNIMVGSFGEVQVMDWGLAKILGRTPTGEPDATSETTAPTEIRSLRDSDQDYTQAGSVMGTPSFMAPEQAIGAVDQIDQRTDVFGLGAILCQMLTSKPPYLGDNSESIRQLAARAKLEDAFARLEQSQADPELVKLCKSCLSVEKAERPKSGEAVAEVVARLRVSAEERVRQAELEATRAEVTLTEQTKRRRLTYVAGSLLLLTFLIGGIVALVYAGEANRNAERAETNEKLATKRAEEIEAEQENTKRSLAYSTLLLAEATWNGSGTADQADELLQRIPERFHNWEHRFLKHKYQGSFATYFGHTRTVSSVSFSPDGARIVSGSRDKTIRVWDARTGQSLLVLTGHAGSVNSVSFSPDGSRIVSGSRDKSIRVWDARTGQSLLVLTGHAGEVESVSFNPDGSRIASGSSDKTIRVWDARTGRSLSELKGHTRTVSSVNFSPDGSRITSGSDDFTIRLWDTPTGHCLIELSGHTSTVTSVSFSPDGSRIASGSGDETIRIWDARTGQRLFEIQARAGSVRSLSFSPDGSRIASGSGDQTIRIWDVRTGRSLLELKGHAQSVNSVSFSPDGSRIASASGDQTIRIWDARIGQSLIELKGHAGYVRSVSFSPDGSWIASGSDDNTIRVWDARTGRSLLELQGHTQSVIPVVISPDGSRIASGSDDNTIRVWDATTGQNVLELTGHTEGVSSVSFSSDGSRIASGSDDKTIRIWDARTGQSLHQLAEHTSSVTSVVFSPDGSRIASGSYDTPIRIWDARTGQSLRQLDGHTQGVTSLSFSPDGSQLASGSGDRSLRIWDPRTGQSLLELKGHSAYVSRIDFSPDGSRIASGSADRTVRIWDARTGQSLLELKGHAGYVSSVSFSPDGSRIASGSDGTIRIWQARSEPQLSIEKEWPAWAKELSPGATSPDGKFVWFGQADGAISPDGKFLWLAINDGRFRRVSLEIGHDELAFRKAMWRPDPIWHREQLAAAKTANDPYAEKVQTYLLHKAIAEEHFDYNRWDQAFYWSVAAELLKPKPPVIDRPELLPKPKERK